MFMYCGFLTQYKNCQYHVCSTNSDNGKFIVLRSECLGDNTRFDKQNLMKCSVTWNRLYAILENQLVCNIGFPSETQGDLLSKLQEEDIQVSCIGESLNILCYLSTDGDCKGRMKGSSKWENISLSNNEKTNLSSISCGDRYLAGISDRNQAYLIDFDQIINDKVPIFRPICPKIQIKRVSCGKEHIILLSTIGTVFTQGAGSRGQLGHGTIDNCPEPCMVEGLQAVTVVDISAGGWHSAVVSDIGDIYCWGWNESGQLGLPCETIQRAKNSGSHESTVDCVNIATLPELVDLAELTDDILVTGISCGSRHTAAITDRGQLYTWGWNEYGQLGHDDNLCRDKPTQVSYLTEQNNKVSNVLCGGWTTLIEIQP